MKYLKISTLFVVFALLFTVSCSNKNIIPATVTSIVESDGGEGTVVLIDKGSVAGIKLNQEGWVIEKGDTIATITVNDVKPDTSRAVVLEHTPFKAVTKGLTVRFEKNGTILSPETSAPAKPCPDIPGPYVPTLGGNVARTGSYDEKGVPSPLGVSWKFGTFSHIATYFPPVAEGSVFLGDSFRFYSVDSETGGKKLQFPVSLTVAFTPTVFEGVLYIPDDRFFIAVDTTTGTEKWRVDVTAAAPIVTKDRIFLATWDGIFMALDRATGKEIWRIETGSQTITTPALDGDTVYFGGAKSFLYAVDANSGKVKWKYDLGEALISSWVVVDKGSIYIAGTNYLIALDKLTHTEKWRFKIDVFLHVAPAVACNTVYIFSGASLYALNAKTGLEKWRFDLKEIGVEKKDVTYDPPIVVGGIVYFGGLDESVYAVDAETGKLLWSYKTEYKTSTPVIVDGVLYVTSGPYLYAIK
jgi:outer membrane protein assembly factor BamB